MAAGSAARFGENKLAAMVNGKPLIEHALEAIPLCFMVADQPMLKRKTVAQELEFFRAHSKNIVGLGHNGVRGNPCLFPARFFPELLSLEGDVGGSAVIKRHLDDLLLFEAPETELCDVDTKEALEALKKR